MASRLGKPTSFFIGARLNPTSEDPEQELADAYRKLAAGASFLLTAPVYDLEALVAVLDALKNPTIPVLLGVLPLRDFNHTEFLRHEVPGIQIPDAIVQRMRDSGERGVETGIEIAAELIEAARGRVQGAVLTSASGSVIEMLQLLERLPARGV